MQYIYQRPGWPEFTWDSEALATALAAVRHAQGRHLGKMEVLGSELRAEASLSALTTEVVKSWAIEGETLNPEEVRSSAARRLGIEVAGLPNPSRQVDGIVEMMLDAAQGFELPLTAERLCGWHAALFSTGRSGMGSITVGAWRTAKSDPMQVVSGILGRERVHFEAPGADLVPAQMATFLTWFNSPPPIDPVLRAAIAHLWFVTIHPFQDGNGRIGRAIADMSLSQADGSKERYYSLSSQIEADRTQYYEQLQQAQRGDLDITPWLTWFLLCLDRSIEGAAASITAVLNKAKIWQQINRRPVNDRQREVINRLLDGFEGFLTSSKYAKLIRCSSDTALRDLNELVERGLLVKNPGGGRSTSYRLASPEDFAD